MEDKIYLNNLYDYYGELLTEKQRDYFKASYFNDWSLSEIAEHYGVSRNAVYGQLKQAEEHLLKYEHILQLYQKRIKIMELLKEEREDLIKKIEPLL